MTHGFHFSLNLAISCLYLKSASLLELNLRCFDLEISISSASLSLCERGGGGNVNRHLISTYVHPHLGRDTTQ
jgi:hypothetical protein